MTHILFVCTGNTCRSPMAEAWFNHVISLHPDLCGKYCAFSRGLYVTGGCLSPNAQAALNEAGAASDCYLRHCPGDLTAEDIAGADIIYGITQSHAERIDKLYPQAHGKIRAFPTDIPDPYGGSLQTYRECLAQIRAGIDEIIINHLRNRGDC